MCRAVEPDAESIPLFLNLLPAPFHPVIAGYRPDPGVLVLGAMADGALLGAIVARRSRRAPGDCTIECLLVARPGADDSGVERFLLSAGEERIKALGFQRVQLAFKLPHQNRGEHILLTLLKRAGWDHFCRQSTRFYAKDQSITTERWYRLEAPNGYELFRWNELTGAERHQLAMRVAAHAGSAERYLDPLVIKNFDDYTSFGMRKQSDGSVAGWMITEPVSPCLLCFRRLYVMPAERNRGLFYPLVANAIKLCLERGLYATFSVASDNNKMREVLLRMLSRHCTAILDCFYCGKRLNAGEKAGAQRLQPGEGLL